MEISGFYYDQQLSSKELTVTLHANTKLSNARGVLSSDESPKWDPWPGEHLDSINPSTPQSGNYGITPIFRGIFSEDFQLDVLNSWTNFDGGNAIENFYNSIKPYSPFLRKGGDLMKAATEKAEKSGGFVGNVASTINTWVKSASGFIGDTGRFLNNALKIQGTRYAYYTGSDVNFSNFTFKTIFFSEYTNLWKKDAGDGLFYPCEPSGEVTYVSSLDKLRSLLPYLSGTYRSFKSSDFGDGDVSRSEIVKALETSKLVGWQRPPGGFEMENTEIDSCSKGTLRAIFNNYYTIENLKINQSSIYISKEMTQIPGDMTGQKVPLYIELTLQLSPAGVFTDRALRRFINLNGTKDEYLKWKTSQEDENENASIDEKE